MKGIRLDGTTSTWPSTTTPGWLSSGPGRRESADLRPLRGRRRRLLPAQGVTIERVMTDNARNYRRSKDFKDALGRLGIAHRRTRQLSAPDQWKGGAVQPDPARKFAYKSCSPRTGPRSVALGPWVIPTMAPTSYGHRGARPSVRPVKSALPNSIFPAATCEGGIQKSTAQARRTVCAQGRPANLHPNTSLSTT